MGDILSQDEIDKLLKAFSSGELDADELKETKEKQVKNYDFSRPSKFSNEHLRTLEIVFDHYCRLLSTHLPAYLRVSVQAEVVQSEAVIYSEFSNALSNPVLLGMIDFEPLEGNIIVEILVGGDGDVLIARVGDAVDQDHIVRVQMEIDGADIFQLRADLVKAAVSAENILRQCAGLFVAEAVFPVREVPGDFAVLIGHALARVVAERLLPEVVPGAFDLFGIDGRAVILTEAGHRGGDLQREGLLPVHDHVDIALRRTGKVRH